jgi:hypothetical protein
VLIVGGGAAGMMAAITAADSGAEVTLFERNEGLGRKVRITGKGRCNVTNDCDINEFLNNVPTNPRFLYTALARFSTQDTKDFFESAGVPLKTERGNRAFPVSDKASDVVEALRRELRAHNVRIVFDRVTDILVKSGDSGAEISGIKVASRPEALPFDRVILATGGIGQLYSHTTNPQGAVGDGMAIAFRAGAEERRNHYFGNLDIYRNVTTNTFMADFEPASKFFRYDPYDNQRGEVEDSKRGYPRWEVRANMEMVSLEELTEKYDISELKEILEDYFHETGSPLAGTILEKYDEYIPYFKKIVPKDYQRMLTAISRFEEQGVPYEKAVLEAFREVSAGG